MASKVWENAKEGFCPYGRIPSFEVSTVALFLARSLERRRHARSEYTAEYLK